MSIRPRLALFSSGVFFGGGLDHLLFIAYGTSRSHYGLHLSPLGQLAFALLDFGLAWGLYRLHRRWTQPAVVT